MAPLIVSGLLSQQDQILKQAPDSSVERWDEHDSRRKEQSRSNVQSVVHGLSEVIAEMNGVHHEIIPSAFSSFRPVVKLSSNIATDINATVGDPNVNTIDERHTFDIPGTQLSTTELDGKHESDHPSSKPWNRPTSDNPENRNFKPIRIQEKAQSEDRLKRPWYSKQAPKSLKLDQYPSLEITWNDDCTSISSISDEFSDSTIGVSIIMDQNSKTNQVFPLKSVALKDDELMSASPQKEGSFKLGLLPEYENNPSTIPTAADGQNYKVSEGETQTINVQLRQNLSQSTSKRIISHNEKTFEEVKKTSEMLEYVEKAIVQEIDSDDVSWLHEAGPEPTNRANKARRRQQKFDSKTTLEKEDIPPVSEVIIHTEHAPGYGWYVKPVYTFESRFESLHDKKVREVVKQTRKLTKKKPKSAKKRISSSQ